MSQCHNVTMSRTCASHSQSFHSPLANGVKRVRWRRGFAPLQTHRTTVVPTRNKKTHLVVNASDVVIDVETVTGSSTLYAPKKKVKGKTVVITGGSQGCGKETALLFAKQGYNVVVAARYAWSPPALCS
eukprot:1178184-Prorocentrum_minimum.AAC.9